ncbi:hypothetical protein KKR91_16065 [Arthrobacter jiangjiafuii]|uniref:Uncharacterized protein n=1 Tax=Arthrobacter jiangjiafuii TaxID=2817475 RepID=A0A975R0W9_9MICC|nr:hypothetical protein [Arthrobacter jiangjiafuii]MBP3042296.1 hypothetical protein [Arthrobacter jiangjiafuii]QWC09948.1 hypothetical protein KKR91_16065 [Arthrobacter jiangjiafuii]
MSTESGNTGRPGAANSSADNSNPLGPDGGPIRDRSDRLAPADETQVLPAGATSAGPARAGAAESEGGTDGASARRMDASPHDDGTTRAMPLSATKDPHQDYAADNGNRPEVADDRTATPAGTTDTTAAGAALPNTALPNRANREALLALEKERFGGIKFGAAFFGWLTATGMVVLLSALAAAIGAAVGFSTDNDLDQSLDQAMANQSAGIIGVVVLLLVLLLAYYAGGYVAGRMARFNGLKQGLAVWIWALIAGVVVVVLGLVFDNNIRSITALNTVAPLPEDLDGASAVTWIAIAATLAASLLGALLGGLAGMRYHRRIDRADFSDADVRA